MFDSGAAPTICRLSGAGFAEETLMRPQIEFTDAPDRKDVEAVGELLGSTRPGDVPPWDPVPLACFLRRPDGSIEGGLSGHTMWNWAYIELFFVPAERRGQGLGSELLTLAEAEARRRGCTDIHLNTFSWQAKPFYEKLGYRQWGELTGFPGRHTRHYMTKKL